MLRLPNASPVFETFWRFAAERQAMYERRLAGEGGPWTTDPILACHRFTNAFRAADRVSQYLIRDVIYRGDQAPEEVVFRILLFKFFNKIETWKLLEDRLGALELSSFDPARAAAVLTSARSDGRTVYSSAYIIPPIPGEPSPKHGGHLRTVADLIAGGLVGQIQSTSNLRDLFFLLRRVPGLGDFLAYQFAIDICYSDVVCHDEDEFVVAGPGALDGLSKVFPGMDLRGAAEVIAVLTRNQEASFDRLGLRFHGLFGRRLHLIDVQNLFCEISKYSRVAHPEYPGVAGRTRIKQLFKPAGSVPTPWFPPKWRLPVPSNSVTSGDANSFEFGQLALI